MRMLPMDAYRSDGTWYVQFDLPGVDPKDVDLTVERNLLTLRAVRRAPQPEGADVVAAERPRGTYVRRLRLGEALDSSRVEARFEAGVLTVTVPVAAQSKPRRIEIAGTTPADEDAESTAA
jgi:HSP20 family protein